MASISCREARQRLDNGIEPGAASIEQTTLGFHLASCPACRAYRHALNQALLIRLLEQPARPIPQPRPPRSAQRQPYRTLAFALLALCSLLLVTFVAKVGYAAWSLRSNVQAYIIATATPSDSHALVTVARVPTQVVAAPNPALTQKQAQLLPSVQPQQSDGLLLPTLVPIMPTAAAQAGLIPTLGLVTPTMLAPMNGDAITVLVLGSDLRPGETGPARTDTIMLARIDPGRQRVALLSLPRDLIVEIPGYGYGRINSAYATGELNLGVGGGMTVARSSVSRLINTPIDYAVFVDFEGFIGLIDAIGGINVDVPAPLYDNAYPTMDYGYMEISFDAGLQHMDGARALEYARLRHADSDFERVRRQQTIVLQVLDQLASQNIVTALDQAVTASAALRGYVWTDMPEERMLGLAWSLRQLKSQQIERFVVDENIISFNGITGACSSADDYWAECIDRQALADLLAQWRNGALPRSR